LCLLLPLLAWAKPVTRTVQVDGVARTALVYPGRGAGKVPSPLLLAFHGFSGTSESMASISNFHSLWPEATVVYPQGSVVEMRTNPPKHQTGWQFGPGREGDRDLRFIDALLADLKAAYQVDPRQVYATGVSNGALMTYLLFTYRPHDFTAFATVAGTAPFVAEAVVPKPILIIQGKKDDTVKLEQATATRDTLRHLNRCDTRTSVWAPGYVCYPGNRPVIWHQHGGGHWWPLDASEHIMRFFKERGELGG
jgi:polyhydroxybutyrate depolymerase